MSTEPIFWEGAREAEPECVSFPAGSTPGALALLCSVGARDQHSDPALLPPGSG